MSIQLTGPMEYWNTASKQATLTDRNLFLVWGLRGRDSSNEDLFSLQNR